MSVKASQQDAGKSRSSSGRPTLYCSRLGQFTGFERARRSWVIQEVLRRRASSQATLPRWQERKLQRAAVLGFRFDGGRGI